MKHYCIYLKSSGRVAFQEEQFKAQDIPVEFVKGIEGDKLGIRHVANYYTPGMLGCFLSHKLIIEQIARSNTKEICAIYEDDAVLSADYICKLNRRIKYLPKLWDIALLGYMHTQGSYSFPINLYWGTMFYKNPHGFYGYIINGSEGAKVIAEYLDTITDQVDIQVFKKVKEDKIKGYLSIRPIVGHRGVETTVQSYKVATPIDK